MTDFSILSIDEHNKHILIDWGYITLNHEIPLHILENPELPEEDMLRHISYMRPPVPEQVDVPEKLKGLVKKTPLNMESEAMRVRAQRDMLLTQCDWTQLDDAPVDRSAWATYRQQLREVPQQEGFPLAVVWPKRPQG